MKIMLHLRQSMYIFTFQYTLNLNNAYEIHLKEKKNK